ncbi:MAG: MSHA biogenesis protein MshM [Pseudohongiellaceae bacterium]|jgi:MSHA biogenesis protein MshM
MYQDYFSLQRHPFRITPDTSLFFSGGDQGRGVVLDAMLYAIESGEGILKVVGEVGSGKTMLCRMLEEQLPETTEVVYIANPNLSPEDILYAVAFELKLPVRRDTSKLLVMQQLQNHLLKQHGANKKVLVIIEEAQGMPVATLEEIRLFSNLETHRDKLMQIILFGQPELDKNLSVRHIRQLRERITHSFYLTPLGVEETAQYIRFRLSAAGCPCPQLFSSPAEWLIAKASGGLTRRINILADKAMLSAFSENVLRLPEKLGPDVPPVITARHVIAAIKDSEYSLSLIEQLFSPLRIAGASLVAVTLLFTLMLWPRSVGIASMLPSSSIENPRESVSDLVDTAPAKNTETLAMPLLLDGIIPTLPSVEVPKELLPVVRAQKMSIESIAVVDADLDLSALSSFRNSLLSEHLTRERLQATRDWLAKTNSQGYTIQFLSGASSDLGFAESFLQLMAREGLDTNSIVCVSTMAGETYWTVKHGSFAGLSLATDFIEKLPQHIRDFKPFVQNINGIECNSNDSIVSLITEQL